MQKKMKRAKDEHFIFKYNYLLMTIVLIFAVMISAAYLHMVWINYDAKEQTSAITLAKSVATQLHYEKIVALDGNEDDIETPEYLDLKSHLSRFLEITPTISSAYILREKGDEVVYLVDSKPLNSSDFSLPGTIFTGATDEIKQLFTTKETILITSLLDREATWNSALVPIYDETSNEVVALLRLDFHIQQWNQRIEKMMVSDVIISLFFICFSLVIYRAIYSYLQAKSASTKYVLTATLYRSIFNQASIGIAIVEDKNFVSKSKFGDNNMNPMFEKILGRSSQELEKINWLDITHPDDLEDDIKMFQKFKNGDIEGYSLIKRFLKPDGSYVWTFMTINHFSDEIENDPLHLCLLRDITSEKEISSSLDESERSKSVLLSNLPGMAYRCIKDDNWRMQFVSSGCLALTGYTVEQLVNKKNASLKKLIAPEYHNQVDEEWKSAIEEMHPYRYEYEIIAASGERKWVLDMAQPIYNDKGEVEALEGIMFNISTRKSMELKLKYTYEHDEDTGLFNVATLHNRLRADDKSNNKQKRALISINLSTFQRISMVFGFIYTANLFRKVANRLEQYSTINTTLFKTYENRLVFYVKGYKNKEELVDFALKIKDELYEILRVERVGAGIGILEINNSEKLDINFLSKRALMASNKVINLDKTEVGICFFDETLEERVLREETVKKTLTEIVDNQGPERFYMVFQPILNLKTQCIDSFEALARLKHDTLGQISPLEFIPIAEESKLIIPLGWNIFRLSFKFMKKLEKLGYDQIQLSINVSAVQLFTNDFVGQLFALIKEMEINASKITLELTESVFSSDLNMINNILLQLRSCGLQISIDDFGTGYSSLSRERDLKVDSLKIDKFFIDRLMLLSDEESITGDIITMAHKLGQVVVAEGVEHERQKNYLIANHCDLIQGYLISKPLEEQGAIDILAHNLKD